MANLRKANNQFVNTFSRVVGVGFVLVGGIFALWGLSLVLDPKATVDVNGAPSSDPWIKSIVLVAGLVISVLGMLLLLARRVEPNN